MDESQKKEMLEMLPAKGMGEYWTSRWNVTYSDTLEYLGDALFPPSKTSGTKVAWLKGYKGLPVGLKTSNLNATPEVRSRQGVQTMDSKLAFFRESMYIDEDDRQSLMNVALSNPTLAAELESRLYDDVGTLIDAARVSTETMRMQLLQGGKIEIVASGVDYKYDFTGDDAEGAGGYTENNTLTIAGDDAWNNDETSNPIADIEQVLTKMRNLNGTVLTDIIMNTTTYNAMRRSAAVKQRAANQSQRWEYLTVTAPQLRAVMLEDFGLTIHIYDKQYKDEGGNNHKFIKDGNVIFIPSIPIGRTVFGTTPHEANMQRLNGGTSQVSVVNTGVAIANVIDEVVVNVQTIVSQLVLPVCERLEETFFMQVFDFNVED